MNCSKPLISIVIPVYNVAPYIERCLSSVLSQTVSEYKLIILNDGSSDESWDIAEKMLNNDSRVVLVRKKNEGLGETRNLGIRMSETEYVTFLDSDDWWRNDYLENMLNGIFAGGDIVVSGYYNVDLSDDKGKGIQKSDIRLAKGCTKVRDQLNILSRMRNFAWGKVYKRELFIKNNTWFPSHAYEDVSVVSYLVACSEKVYCIDEPLYFYRKNRKGSIRSDLRTLSFLAESMDELYSRFLLSGKLKYYEKQIRQLFWGQYCFVKKWIRQYGNRLDKKEIEELSNMISRICFFRFPELESFSKGLFYSDECDKVLKKALQYMVNEESCITLEREKADYIITKEHNDLYDDDPRSLIVDVDYNKSDVKNETIIWNIVEEIMSQL